MPLDEPGEDGPDLSALKAVIVPHGKFNQQVVDQHAAAFRDEMAYWRLYQSDPKSPLLPDALKSKMLTAYEELVRHLTNTPHIHQLSGGKRALYCAAPALALQSQLWESPAITEYAGDKARVVQALVGSVIGRALKTAETLGVVAPHVSDELFR